MKFSTDFYREHLKNHFIKMTPCSTCNGNGGFDTRPEYGGDPMEDDIYYWKECYTCDGYGYLENHIREIRRYIK